MIDLNILCWNYRGISEWETSSRVIYIIKQHKSSLVYLIETRADDARLDRFCAYIPRSWDWASIIGEGYSGSIIALWNKNIGWVTPIAASCRALHLIISLDNVTHVVVSIVYNSHLLCAQCSLWQELTRISSTNLPWPALVILILLYLDLNTRVVRMFITLVKQDFSLTSLIIIICWILTFCPYVYLVQ